MACAGNPYRRSPDQWAHARQIAERYLRDRYGTNWKITGESHGLPYLFEINVEDASSVLVHDDAIFTQRGLAGLDLYLRQSRCIEQRLPSTREMMHLVGFLGTYPPGPRPHGYFTSDHRIAAFRPHLDYLDGGTARLVLTYRIWEEDLPGYDPTEGGDSDEDDPEWDVSVWTLRMDPGQMPVWTSEQRVYNEKTHRWRAPKLD